MRHGHLLLLLVIPACNIELADPPEPPPASMRERLADLTRLQVAPAASSGSVMVGKKDAGAWETSGVALAIENGELFVSSDAPDAVTLEGFQVSFAPFALPAGTFGEHDARLEHVRVDVETATRAPAVWTSDNHVTLALELAITLSWTLTIDGSPTPLGSPRLPLVPIELSLSGDGQVIDAELRATAPGDLWSWAGLIKLGELQLVVGAELVEP